MPREQNEKRDTKQSSRNRVREVLEKYVSDLGWNQTDLATKSGISKSQISRWMGETSDASPVPRDQINRLSYVIALGYRERDPRNGAARLETILYELLDAGGYEPVTSHQKNKRWQEITGPDQQRQIEVGCIPWKGLWDLSEPKRDGIARKGTELTGPLVEVLGRTCGLMGVSFGWRVLSTWKELMDTISKREVDLTAVLHLPAREAFLRFSIPIFEEGISMMALVPRDFRGEDSEHHQFLVAYVEGEVGEVLARKLLPYSSREKGFEKAEKACEYVRDQPVEVRGGAEVFRCFVADELVCEQMLEEYGDSLKRLPLNSNVSLPLAFAVHLKEEKLAMAVNQALRDLARNDALGHRGRRGPASPRGYRASTVASVPKI